MDKNVKWEKVNVPKVAVKELVQELPVNIGEENLSQVEQTELVFVGGNRPFQWVHEEVIQEAKRGVFPHIVPRIFVDTVSLYKDFDYYKRKARRHPAKVLEEYILNGLNAYIKEQQRRG